MNRIQRFILNIVLISIAAFGLVGIVGALLGLRAVGDAGGLLIGGGLLLILFGAGGAVTGGRVAGSALDSNAATLSAHIRSKMEYDKVVQSSRSGLTRLLDIAETLQFALVGIVMFVIGLAISH
jgi:hypothetical protein